MFAKRSSTNAHFRSRFSPLHELFTPEMPGITTSSRLHQATAAIFAVPAGPVLAVGREHECRGGVGCLVLSGPALGHACPSSVLAAALGKPLQFWATTRESRNGGGQWAAKTISFYGSPTSGGTLHIIPHIWAFRHRVLRVRCCGLGPILEVAIIWTIGSCGE